jgi:AraC-like DNA-binding protein
VTVRLQAADEPAATREDYWRQVVAQHIVPMEVRFAGGPPSPQEAIVAGTAGPVECVESICGPGEARRTPRHMSSTDPDHYQLFVQLDGATTAEQPGRRVALAPREFSLSDLAQPFHCVYPARTALLLRFPRPLMPLPERALAAVLATRFRGDRGTGALVYGLARELERHLDDASAPRLGSALLDLLVATLAARLDRQSPATRDAHQRALVHRIHAFIDSRLGDPDLTPASIAAAHHISLRYLHKLFSTEETTVAEHVRRKRLERCRRDLVDPLLADQPVSAVARRWGLPNAAHFSRAFRDAFGLPPGEYRAVHLGRSAGSDGGEHAREQGGAGR